MIKRWLIRGDTHGRFGWMDNGALTMYKPEETAIIILGDAGFNFFLNEQDDRLKKEVNDRGFRFYCVRGNHEARPQDVDGMKATFDAAVDGWVYLQEEYPNIRYFFDFGEYKIDKYHVAVIGGAYSVDKPWRLRRAGVTSRINPDYYNPKVTGWFPNEQLTEAEMKDAYDMFVNKTYDFVFSHTCPISWQPTDLFLSLVDQKAVDSSMEYWLEYIKNSIGWCVWCFGHYHADRLERPRVEMYYNDLEELQIIYERWEYYDTEGHLKDWWLVKSPNFYMD
jgi:3-oxoacid CoA-transferase subunit A